jgi:hypothetical protein
MGGVLDFAATEIYQGKDTAFITAGDYVFNKPIGSGYNQAFRLPDGGYYLYSFFCYEGQYSRCNDFYLNYYYENVADAGKNGSKKGGKKR